MINNYPKGLKPRKILPELIKFLDEEEILLLYGMRQTGKTSLLYLLTDYFARNKKIEKNQIVFFDLENIAQFEELEKIKQFEDFLTLLREKYKANLKKRIFVFIDEIQHLSNPSPFLKYLYDHYKPKLKFIVSGSSSLEIKKKFSDALTGRIFRFEILPLSYKEFLSFNKISASSASFEEFILYGGFPAVCLKKDRQTKIRLLKEIYSLYIRRDIKDIGRIEDVLAFNKLAGVLAAQNGGLVSEVNLANAVGISRPTVKNYLFLLQNTFVIDLVPPFFSNPKKEITKMPKLYFNDTGLRNAIIDNFLELAKRTDSGILAENAVFSELKKTREEKIAFWRTDRKQEVDFIVKKGLEIIPLEVKYQCFKKPAVPPNLKSFIEKYRPKKALIITSDFAAKTKYLKTKIEFVPAFRFSRKMF